MTLKRGLRIRNIAFIFLLAAALALSCCAEDDGSGYTFRMNIEENPLNLDPQMAEDESSLMIISNMMEGLVKTSDSGGIVPAAAERFEMSEDGLTYTFYLKQNRKWESAAKYSSYVKADDFVFAFRRIFDPETDSPYSNDYLCIKNGSAVINGLLPLEELGVRAVDDLTVEFTLEYPYYDFLSLLTKTAAMPCSRDFFEFTEGRYGMAADSSASNGAFFLNEWNFDPYWNDNYIIMRRNKSYNETEKVYPYSLNFFITGDASSDAESFAEGDTDCFISDGADEKLLAENKYVSAGVKTAGLIFDPDSKYFKNSIFREALAKSINREAYSHTLPEGLTEAFGIIPSGITVQGKSYRSIVPDRVLSEYDAGAAQIWSSALGSMGIGSVDNVKITVPDSFAGSEMIYSMTDRWRNELLFDCGVEIVSQTEYEAKLADGDFDIALIEVSCNDNSPYEFLKFFYDDGLFAKYSDPELVSTVNGIKTAVSLTSGTEKIKKAESLIIKDHAFIPLCYENKYMIYGENSADIVYYPFISSVYFGEAKSFD